MRKDTGIDGDAQRISQLDALFKIYDDSELERELRTKIINPSSGPPQVAQLGFGR